MESTRARRDEDGGLDFRGFVLGAHSAFASDFASELAGWRSAEEERLLRRDESLVHEITCLLQASLCRGSRSALSPVAKEDDEREERAEDEKATE